MDQHLVLDVRLLGGFETRVGDRLVPAPVWGQRRAAAIVKLLALEPGCRLHREHLLDLLWPELEPESAANNLRVALHHARRGLEDAGAPAGVFLARDGDALLLGPREMVLVDVEQFARAAARAWQSADPDVAERAAALYRGGLLPDDPYEDWAAARREAIRASYLTLLTRLSGLHEERGDFARAIVARERALETEPLDEATHAAIVRLYAIMGQRDLALARYARFAALLERELGVAPERETRELAAAIRDGRLAVASSRPSPPARAPMAAAAARLPAAVDALVGRERELAELEKLLTSSRLVTLTGPGGIGKTRLAQETARALGARYPDGVAFVDLSALRDPALVLPTVARALGVEVSGGQSIGLALAAAIGDRRLLMVFDNLEQVVAAAPDIAALLAACPNQTILGTSRARLRLRGEQEYPVSPLSLPERSQAGSEALLPDLEQAPAVALFTRRAQSARPGFRLTAGNVDAVAAVCRRLDGLPLAIELAAARVRVLSPEQLLRRMARPLDVLGMTAADVPERQRTLRGTIAWSHDLLTPDEQILFRRLGVFAGGFTLEGAEHLARPFPLPPSPPSPLDLLASHVDQSLVVARPDAADDETRYAMLETIREFAVERLRASGEAEEVQQDFETYLLDFTERAETGLLGPEQTRWLDRFEVEHDNIRAALSAALEREDGDMALALAPAIAPFWRSRGYALEGRAWLERALALAGETSVTARAAALDALGGLAIDLGEYDAADAYYRESVDLWWKIGDRRALIQGLYALSIARTNRGAFDEAQGLLEEALGIAQDLPDERAAASILHNLGIVARETGKLDRAIELLSEAMSRWRGLGDPHWIGVSASDLGDAHRLAGEPERARACFDESAELFCRLGDRFALGVVANHRGLLELDAGHADAAMPFHGEALRHFDAVRAPLGTIESIEWLAVSIAASAQALTALHLFGATAAARAALGLARLAIDAALVEDGLDLARQTAGPAADAALAAGAALTLDQARDAALALAGASDLGSTVSVTL